MRILYLCRRYYWDHKMSRGARFHAPKAVARQPGVEMRFSGEGWPEWDATQSCTENFARWSWRPDWLWCYKPEDHIGVAQSLPLKVVTYNEAWWPDRKALAEVRAMRADLVVCHHENDLPQFAEHAGEVVHVPHGAEAEIFYVPADVIRPVDCLVSGVISDEIYPVRGRLKKLVETGKLSGQIRKHPGYRLQGEDKCEHQCREYALALGTAKIALCCTSRYKYALAKLFEAALAGCAVATDMPDDSVFVESLGRHVIEIDERWTDSQIVGCLQSHLADPDALRDQAAAGQAVALEHFTMDRYAEKLLGALRHAEEKTGLARSVAG